MNSRGKTIGLGGSETLKQAGHSREREIIWRPGVNPLTGERPFQLRTVSPLEAAVYAAALGPALLLKPDAVNWLVVLLLLPLNALVFCTPGNRFRLNSLSGLVSLLCLLTAVPLELDLLDRGLAAATLGHSLPLMDLSFVLITHLSVLFFLMGRARMSKAIARRWGVQAAFLLPLPLLGLFALSALETTVLDQIWLPRGVAVLCEAGVIRLVIMLLSVGVFQLVIRRRQRTRNGEGAGGVA